MENDTDARTHGSAAASDILRQHFGFDEFLPGQREVIEMLLSGQSAVAVFPTGGGKSLCYQLPALMLPGLCLVVSPLIALMKDQIDALSTRGIAAARIDSTLSADQYSEVTRAVSSNRLRLLYVAPERFNNERFREAMRRTHISLFAVDEAHCISEWGHNFRPDYLKLASFARMCGAERVLGLTATATEQVLADICRLFDISAQCSVRTRFYRSNLTVLTTPVARDQRESQLLDRLRDRPAGPSIVYVTLQRTAERLAQLLSDGGLPARPYHAGMQDEQRTEVQDWFMQSDRGVVVATIAFGMGIDKADIRYVYHFNLPKSLENFAQEIGRSGRDGKPAVCEMFVCPDDLNVLENFIYGDTPGRENIQGFLSDIFSQRNPFDVSFYDLSSTHDIRMLVVRTLMTYLELDGFIEAGTPFYSSYKFQPLVSSADILGHFGGQRRVFLANLLRHARKAKTWFHLDVDSAAADLGAPRDRIVRALDYMAQQQWLELQVAGVRQAYRFVQKPADLDDLAASLHQRTLERESRELARLQQVLDLAGHNACQVSALGAHFGEPLESPCGHCSWCCGEKRPLTLPPRHMPESNEAVWSAARQLRAAHPDLLSDARALTRLLCGISSPKLVRAKLTRHKLFGELEHVPFGAILERASRDV